MLWIGNDFQKFWIPPDSANIFGWTGSFTFQANGIFHLRIEWRIPDHCSAIPPQMNAFFGFGKGSTCRRICRNCWTCRIIIPETARMKRFLAAEVFAIYVPYCASNILPEFRRTNSWLPRLTLCRLWKQKSIFSEISEL